MDWPVEEGGQGTPNGWGERRREGEKVKGRCEDTLSILQRDAVKI